MYICSDTCKTLREEETHLAEIMAWPSVPADLPWIWHADLPGKYSIAETVRRSTCPVCPLCKNAETPYEVAMQHQF